MVGHSQSWVKEDTHLVREVGVESEEGICLDLWPGSVDDKDEKIGQTMSVPMM